MSPAAVPAEVAGTFTKERGPVELNETAKGALRDAGVSQAAWAQAHWLDGKWHGDACGCPDDRCIGYHHDEDEDCGCLPVLLHQSLPWPVPWLT